MVDAVPRKQFDPAAHLTRQGWKGKGTALKHGHAVRPLAVVQKKTLSGVGKDRDEAVPFWDHIFASTAASLSLPTTPSASPGPSSPRPLLPPPTSTSSSWVTATYDPDGSSSKKPKAPALNAGVRAGKEVARRGLYSRFLRGRTIIVEPEDEAMESGLASGDHVAARIVDQEEIPSVESASLLTGSSKKEKGKGKSKEKGREGETKEERRARRAERAARKAEKAMRKAAGKLVEEGSTAADSGEAEGRKRRKAAAESGPDAEAQGTQAKEKKKRRRTDEDREDVEADVGLAAIGDGVGERAGKKDKKRRKVGEDESRSKRRKAKATV